MALWAAYLRSKDIKVVQFNAWKSLGADPFDALTREILRQVSIPGSELVPPHKRLLAFLNHYAPIVARGAKLVASLQPELEGVSQVAEVALESVGNIAKPGSECAKTSDPNIESPEAFASLLSSAARTWSDRPIVVMLDELDRCSPEYSVEMLQLLEHVFHAEHVVFVVAINQSELIHSIRSFYGQGFNAEGYLERFFDDILLLPTSNRKQYIESSLGTMPFVSTSSALLFLEASGLSLREINKAVQHLGYVLDGRSQEEFALVDLWIARTLAPEEYRQFIVGEISDKQLVYAIFTKGTCAGLRTEGQQQENYASQQMEVTLVMGSCILPRGSLSSPYYSSPGTDSELYRHYLNIVQEEKTDADVPVAYARSVVDGASSLAQSLKSGRGVSGMDLSARLLEKESSRQ